MTHLTCDQLSTAIAESEREQNDPLIEKIAEMPVDLLSAFILPGSLAQGVMPAEDPIRLSDMRARRTALGCAEAQPN